MKQMPALLRRIAEGDPAAAAARRTSSLCIAPSGKAHRASAAAGTAARKYDWSFSGSAPCSSCVAPPAAHHSRGT